VVDELVKYISELREKELSESDIESIHSSLIAFLLGSQISEGSSREISSFIIKNKGNVEIHKNLNEVKEGLVLYSGIRYTADLNELGTWREDLTIFLDTEIIFYFAGYNGNIYQEIFNDFFKLVKEINQNSGTKKIKLKYFEEIELEINRFFHVAELIMEGKASLNPSKTAMKEIINGCSSKSDVIVKRNKLYISLKTVGIVKEEPKNYYQNYDYVIEGNNVLDSINRSFHSKANYDEETCKTYLKIFTKINVLRRGVSIQGFERCKYVLLSGNNFIHALARHCDVRADIKNVPFSTDIDFVTDKFWFKLKKGFGSAEDKPKSFDVITKAQIVISSQISNTVHEKYTALNEEYKSGKITKEEAVALTYELRESSLKPEEVDEAIIDESVAFISGYSFEEHIREQELLKRKVRDGEKAIIELKSRDRQDRNRISVRIKKTFRFLAKSMDYLAILLVGLFLVLVYKLIQKLIEPEDTKLSLLSLVLGLIVTALPSVAWVLKLRKSLKTRIRRLVKLRIKKLFL
jgi:hypothetical protein